MKTLVINQDKQTARMAFQKNQLESLGIDFQRISSFVLTGTQDEVYQQNFNTWQRPLTVPEVSCFLSHKKAWEVVLSENRPLLILEDDAWLDTKIIDVLKECNDLTNVDYLTFEVARLNRKKLVAKRPKKTICGFSLLRLYQGRSGAAGYILWPSGAKQLLHRLTDNKIGIADKFINSCYSLKSYQIEPGLIVQLDQCAFHGITPPLQVKSTITTKTEMKPKLAAYLRYKMRRILGEIKIGINLLLHAFNTERRYIELSQNFKKSTKI